MQIMYGNIESAPPGTDWWNDDKYIGRVWHDGKTRAEREKEKASKNPTLTPEQIREGRIKEAIDKLQRGLGDLEIQYWGNEFKGMTYVDYLKSQGISTNVKDHRTFKTPSSVNDGPKHY